MFSIFWVLDKPFFGWHVPFFMIALEASRYAV